MPVAPDRSPVLAGNPAPATLDLYRERQRHRFLALLFATGAMAMWVPGGYRELAVREQMVFGSLSVTLLTLAALQVVLATPEGRLGITRWRIGPWYLLWCVLTFGIAPLTWLMPATGSASRIVLPSVVSALGLFGVSLIPWTIGYCAGVPRAVQGAARRGARSLLRGTTTQIRGGSMPWILYGVGITARLVTIATTGRLGYVGDPTQLVSRAGAFDHVLQLLATLSLFAIAAAAYRAFSETTRGSKLTLWVLVAAEAGVGALAGGKQYFLLSVLAVLIPYGVLRGRLSVRILVAGALVFLWIAVPFNTAYRQVVRSESSTLSPAAAVSAAPTVLSGVSAGRSPGEVMLDSSVQMLRRVRMIDSVAITMQLTPQLIPYRSPVEFASAPVVGMIPRALWPGKPVLTTGWEFSQDYYGTSRQTYSSAGITPLGDLYRHGGPLTVIAGMVLLGMAARLFDTLVRPERDPRAMCFLLAFLPVLLRADIYNMIVSIPSGLVLALVGAHLICRSARGPSSTVVERVPPPLSPSSAPAPAPSPARPEPVPAAAR